jgi:hypothetical protein
MPPTLPQFLTTRSILEDKRGNNCSNCQGYKASGFAFCRPCYDSLPRFMQQNLWRPMGNGYQEAFRVARIWLQKLRESAQGVGA